MNKKKIKVLVLVGYGKNGKPKQLSEIIETIHLQYAIYPIGSKFNKDILKKGRAKVVEAELIY